MKAKLSARGAAVLKGVEATDCVSLLAGENMYEHVAACAGVAMRRRAST